MTREELFRIIEKVGDHEANMSTAVAAVDAYTAALLQQTSVSRGAYIFQYSSIGKVWEVGIEAANLNEAMVKFANTYQNVDAVHSITKAE